MHKLYFDVFFVHSGTLFYIKSTKKSQCESICFLLQLKNSQRATQHPVEGRKLSFSALEGIPIYKLY